MARFFIFFVVISAFPGVVDKVHFPGSSFLIGNPVDLIQFLSFFCAGGCFYLFRNQIRYDQPWVFFALPIVIFSLFEPLALRLVLPTLGAYIFFWFSFLEVPVLQRFGTSSDVSYGVYLYGWLSQKLLFWYFPSMSPWLGFVLTCGISFVCGLLSWHLVEKPVLRLKKLQDGKTQVQAFNSHSAQIISDEYSQHENSSSKPN